MMMNRRHERTRSRTKESKYAEHIRPLFKYLTMDCGHIDTIRCTSCATMCTQTHPDLRPP